MSETKEATAARTLTLQCQFCETWNRIDAARASDRPKCGKCGKPMLLDRPFKLTDASFSRTIADAQVPVLVDFYADWCGPCKMMAPAVDELAHAYQGRALVAKVDTDRAQQTAQQYGIRNIPTTVLFKDGKEAARKIGAVPKPQLEAMLKEGLGT